MTPSFPLGVTVDELAAAYPRLYHMAESGSWPSIRRHGLLSTSSLLSLFKVRGAARTKIESAHRPVSVPIRHSEYGAAVVRDQIPMRDADLTKCLRDGTTPREWYELLNSMVFFWVTEQRLETLLGARAYRDKSHTVLILDTKTLVRDCAPRVRLSPMNSGATRPMPHPRGRETFLPLDEYPFKARHKRSSMNAVVELAVVGGVKSVESYVIEVWERSIDQPGRVIWRP